MQQPRFFGDRRSQEEVQNAYPKYFEALERLGSLQNQVLNTPPTNQLADVLRRMEFSAWNSLGAVVMLGSNGYGCDAMKIVRSIFETLLNMWYLINHEGALDLFLAFELIERKRYLYEPMSEEQKTRRDPREVKQFLEDCAAAATKFPKGEKATDWCPLNIRQRAEKAGPQYLFHYKTVYAWMSAIHHGSMGGLTLQASNLDGDLDPAPSHNFVPEALLVGYTLSLECLGLYVEASRIDSSRAEVEAARAGYKELCDQFPLDALGPAGRLASRAEGLT